MVLLDDSAIRAALQRVEWDRDGDALVKEVKGKNFAAALGWVNKVGELAEAANHHPDIDIRWNTVTLRLSTHSEGGLTDKDVELATQIDKLGAP
jgi:4a-hydroxytetrahydrobiopterin dehydratase